jgi:hypothetical protein
VSIATTESSSARAERQETVSSFELLSLSRLIAFSFLVSASWWYSLVILEGRELSTSERFYDVRIVTGRSSLHTFFAQQENAYSMTM